MSRFRDNNKLAQFGYESTIMYWLGLLDESKIEQLEALSVWNWRYYLEKDGMPTSMPDEAIADLVKAFVSSTKWKPKDECLLEIFNNQ